MQILYTYIYIYIWIYMYALHLKTRWGPCEQRPRSGGRRSASASMPSCRQAVGSVAGICVCRVTCCAGCRGHNGARLVTKPANITDSQHQHSTASRRSDARCTEQRTQQSLAQHSEINHSKSHHNTPQRKTEQQTAQYGNKFSTCAALRMRVVCSISGRRRRTPELPCKAAE